MTDSTHQDRTTRPTRIPRPPRPTAWVAVLLLLAWGIYLFADAQLTDYFEIAIFVLIGMVVARFWFGGTNRRGRAGAVVLALSLLSPTLVTSSAQASIDGHRPHRRPARAPSHASELGFGDELPPGSIPSWAGFPCWQMRMEDDFEGFLKSIYGSSLGALIWGAADCAVGLVLLESAVGAGVVGGAVYASWEVLFASGCGACGEEKPFLDWQVDSCGPMGVDCCVPPDRSDRSKRRGDRQSKDDELCSQRDFPKPERPALCSDDLTDSGWQSAEDLGTCPLGVPGGRQQDDEQDEDCYDLSGSACDQLCPPRRPGECAVGCDTCGACIYSPC